MNVREQVELAVKNYGELPEVPLSDDLPEEAKYLATPNRLAFAFGWIVANAIVSARYANSAIDALPVYHPEHGWDRFLLTRRVSSKHFLTEKADSFGLIMLSGEDAPRITTPSGKTRLALGTALRENPEQAIEDAVALFPVVPPPMADLGARWKDRQKNYPVLYQAVTELVLENPGAVASREIFVDDQPIDGAYHPLFLHGAAERPGPVYNWFLVQTADRVVFNLVHGHNTVYETERGTWKNVKKPLAKEEGLEDYKRRLRAWLRIEGEPDRTTVD